MICLLVVLTVYFINLCPAVMPKSVLCWFIKWMRYVGDECKMKEREREMEAQMAELFERGSRTP